MNAKLPTHHRVFGENHDSLRLAPDLMLEHNLVPVDRTPLDFDLLLERINLDRLNLPALENNTVNDQADFSGTNRLVKYKPIVKPKDHHTTSVLYVPVRRFPVIRLKHPEVNASVVSSPLPQLMVLNNHQSRVDIVMRILLIIVYQIFVIRKKGRSSSD